MDNLAKWREYLSGLISPDSYINWGFWYLINASLQRRVWFGPDHMQLFPNMYPMLTGPPGVGKGLVIKKVAEALRYWKLSSPEEVKGESGVDLEDQKTAAAMNLQSGIAEEQRTSGSKKNYDKPLLINVAPDTATFEALTLFMARNTRVLSYKAMDPVLGKEITRWYFHSSAAFCLEELSSFYKKKAEDAINFKLVAYDCGDYKKDTKHQGTDKIRNCCLNFLAGTTPAYMQRIFTEGLLSEGISSRAIFIYENKNRKDDMFIPDLTTEQSQYRMDIYEHIKKLTNLFGRVQITPEAQEYLTDWWKKTQANRPNVSEKLQHYYARKNIHVIKLAMAIHFSDSFEMCLNLSDCQRAIIELDKIEKKMHFALMRKSDNPYYHIGRKILNWIAEKGEVSFGEILAMWYEDLPTTDTKIALEKILEHQIIMGNLDANEAKKVYYIKKREIDNLGEEVA